MDRERLINQVREQYPANRDLYLSFGACAIRAVSNSKAVISALGDYFSDFVSPPGRCDIDVSIHEGAPPDIPATLAVKPPDPGKTKIKEEYADIPGGRIVRKRLTGMVFIFGGGDHLAVGPCLDNINQAVNFINNRYIEWKLRNGGFLGHAAGVIWENRGLALAGFSGAGKSTLALQLMNRGATFVSNDRLIVEKTDGRLTMHGVAKMPRINPGTALNNPQLAGVMPTHEKARFSAMSEAELWGVEHKYDAPINACYGENRFTLSAPMDALVILAWKRGAGKPVFSPADLNERRDLLRAFMKSTGLFYLPDGGRPAADPAADAYAERLSPCKVWECGGGVDFEKAASACLALLETLPVSGAGARAS